MVSNLGSVAIELTEDDLARLDKASAIPPVYPNWIPPMKRGEDIFSRFADLK